MKILISRKEYFDRVFQVAKTVLPTLIKDETSLYLKKDATRESITYMAVVLAKALLKEIGYTPNKPVEGSSRSIPIPEGEFNSDITQTSSKSIEIDLENDEGSGSLSLDRRKK